MDGTTAAILGTSGAVILVTVLVVVSRSSGRHRPDGSHDGSGGGWFGGAGSTGGACGDGGGDGGGD